MLIGLATPHSRQRGALSSIALNAGVTCVAITPVAATRAQRSARTVCRVDRPPESHERPI